jgi:uncharacterized protein YndB with AHSA1/START domain
MVWRDELAAGEIARAFELTAPTISSHLNALRRAGLITMRREGNFRRYRADRVAMEPVVPLLAIGNDKWQVADDVPESRLADTAIGHWVTVTADIAELDREGAYAAFTDAGRYSAWLGVPVRIRDGRFAAELEWGTRVRGHYEVSSPPDLIAMRWDFEDDAVPVPGRQLIGYLRFFDARRGCRIEVHQRADNADQAAFLATAWSTVLGRLRQHAEHLRTNAVPRPPRPKRSRKIT